jgi:hypothetical protein
MRQENAGGVSRDEMAAALMEVVDGRLPKDRIALRELYNEILGWPWLEADEDQTEGTGEAVANYEGITPTGAPSNGLCRRRIARTVLCMSALFMMQLIACFSPGHSIVVIKRREQQYHILSPVLHSGLAC